jgi:hypothetical protein
MSQFQIAFVDLLRSKYLSDTFYRRSRVASQSGPVKRPVFVP